MTANLYGDFVKGKKFSHLPEVVKQGVILHREIDFFIDNHPEVIKLKQKLYKSLPKVSGIAIDLFFDHLLAKNWSDYSKINLSDFIEPFFKYSLNPHNLSFENPVFHYADEFIYLLQIMYEKEWIYQYQQIDGLKMASTGLSNRIPYPNELGKAVLVFTHLENEITQVFKGFMFDAQEKFLSNQHSVDKLINL